MRVARKRVDVAAAAKECDVAILNGGHGVTAEMLLAGKPALIIPLALEQRMMAKAVERMGAGVAGEREGKETGERSTFNAQRSIFNEGLEALLGGEFDGAAETFAQRYSSLAGAGQRVSMLERARAVCG